MKNKVTIVVFILIGITIGGCRVKTEEENKSMFDDTFIPVQDFTGEGFPALAKQEDWDFIEDNKEELESYTKQWFVDNYNIKVEVTYMYPDSKVSAIHGVVKSQTDEKLQMAIIIGVNKKEAKIIGVDESAMEVDGSIMSTIIYKAYQEEFDKLGLFLEEKAKEYHLYGQNDEYLGKSAGAAYTSKYYFISQVDIGYSKTFKLYLENQTISGAELRKSFESELADNLKNDKSVSEEYYLPSVVTSLYSATEKIEEGIAKKIGNELIQQSYLPDFLYSISVYSNGINTRTGRPANIEGYPVRADEHIRIIKGIE